MTGFSWSISLGQILTIAALLAYGVLARGYCLNEIDSCYQRLNNCTYEKFPVGITFNATGLNFTSCHSWLGGMPC